MDKLSKDELMLLAIEFDLPDLLRFCQSSKRINDKICKQDAIWYYKLNKEYSLENRKYFKQKTPKLTYTLLYKLTQLVHFLEKLPQLKKYTLIELYNLKELELSYNFLTTIPKELGNLVNLRELNLINNRLTSIPKELGNLSNLQHLYLSNNFLTTIPKELSNLVNLRDLFLSKNKLTTIPNSLGNLVNLQYLHLDNNLLTTIPKEIFDNIIVNLQELNLDLIKYI